MAIPGLPELLMPQRTLDCSGPVIAPSMLKCDFGELMDEIARLETAGAKTLHWDVMDGHFVPNLSYGALLIEAVRGRTNLFFDAHLMIGEPERYLNDYVRAGCDAITFHIETVPQPVPLLKKIRAAGVLAGLAINPKTPVERIAAAVPDCDVVLVMSVEPGFGGQKFMPEVLPKVQQLRGMVSAKTAISIDGGIGPATIASAANAGARWFVAGSSIFDQPDYTAAIREMEQLATAI
jgi:ribulose-phosphate 3-epimerase